MFSGAVSTFRPALRSDPNPQPDNTFSNTTASSPVTSAASISASGAPACCRIQAGAIHFVTWYDRKFNVTTATAMTQHYMYDNTVISNVTTIYNRNATVKYSSYMSERVSLPGIPTDILWFGQSGAGMDRYQQTIIDDQSIVIAGSQTM